MNKQAILIFVFLMVASSFAQRHILLFTQSNQAGAQTRINAQAVCANLNPTSPFLSGRAGGAYTCHVWNQRNCAGSSLMVSATGTNFWAAGALSAMC
jgi:hypothetical protein